VLATDVFSGFKLIELHQTPSNAVVRFKPNTQYKLLIDAPTNSIVEISTYTTGTTRNLTLFEYVFDIVEASESITYVFNFPDDMDYLDYVQNKQALVSYNLNP
jgi:hypothetical protein